MIILATTSFFAGILTILTPCTLPLLPVVLGSAIHYKNSRRIFLILASLGLSVFVFTLAFKATTDFLVLPESILRMLSGLIILLLGIFYLFPDLWDKIANRIGFNKINNKLFNNFKGEDEKTNAVITGIALGPIFTSCSPTYGYILFAVLPASAPEALLYLVMFILGMLTFLALIALAGQRIVAKTSWAAASNGKFRKFLGIQFILIGILVIFKLDKTIESYLLEQPIIQNLLLNRVEQEIINQL
ncbi:sulfite exporter TauE/SafE family protein [Candidatus Dojkabacteria bacterium]|nr:sulfite exporter TauE/SafE family protein [Candidatus Dojkabacteria bacterium]